MGKKKRLKNQPPKSTPTPKEVEVMPIPDYSRGSFDAGKLSPYNDPVLEQALERLRNMLRNG